MALKLLVVLLFFTSILDAQPFVGLKREVIEQLVVIKYPEYQIESHSRNDKFRYVKYNNSNGLGTWFIFFSNNDVCTETREIYDNVFLESKRMELNSKYKKVKSDTWLCTYKNEYYSILLRPDKWYFVLITTKATQ